MRWTLIVAAAGLAACNPQPETEANAAQAANVVQPVAVSPTAWPTVALPDLSTCPKREPVDAEMRERAGPITVPGALREVARADVDNIAVSTLGGTTVCIDASWFERIDNAQLSPDGRFASFDWIAYEAFGHVIVDRRGKGSEIDTGSEPVRSPSGRLIAAADLTEAGFGALNAFAVWQIEPAGFKRLTHQEEVPPATDWAIGRWVGEDCIELTAVLWEEFSDPDQIEPPARRPYRARRSASWQLEPGTCAAAT